MDLVLLPEGADLDALSSAFGVLKLNPSAVLLKPKQLSKSGAKAFKRFQHLFRYIEEPPQKVERLYLVDTCGFHRINKVPNYGELIVYDHHESCNIPNATLKVDKVGACTTLLVEEIERKGVPLNGEEATLLLLGIYEDTGNFTYLGTTPRDLRAAAFLLEKGADLQTVIEIVEEKISKEELEVLYDLLSGIEYLKTPEGFRVAIATFKGEEYHPDFQELVYQLKEFTEKVDGFFIVYEAGNKTYIFGRANNKNFNVAEVLRRLGGGGHEEAASLKLEGIPAERVKKRLKDLLKGDLENLYIERFMSFPPLLIREDETAKEALQKLVDFGFAGAPVVNSEGKPIGIVFKKELLKALKHLKEKPLKVSEVANTEFRTLHLKDTIWEAEEILSKYGQKLIPVVNDEGRVVGVITRLDIFKNILTETPEGGVKKRVKLPENIEEFAKTVGKIAQRLGMRAYIVGGVVRDILLGRPVWDLDIVVEGGSAVKLAEEIAKHYGVKLHSFEEFGTAHLKVGNLKVEFATARRERYERSGALPKVEPASLKEDILRRDFTINTLVLSINPDSFGEIIDYLGGLEDLKNGVVRVLHSLSFIEDPVRILRGLRFAGRFGFKLSKGTRTLIRRAVELGVLRNAPKGRIANELRLALREERFLEILKLYKEFGILEQLFPEGFNWNLIREDELKKLQDLLKEFDAKLPGWVLLVYLLLPLDKEEVLQFLRELSAPAEVREIFLQAKENLGEILNILRHAKKPSQLREGLKPFRDEVLLIAAVKGGKKIENLVRFYLKEIKPFKVKVDTKPLLERGLKGKELGKEIERLKIQMLDEKLKGRFEDILKS